MAHRGFLFLLTLFLVACAREEPAAPLTAAGPTAVSEQDTPEVDTPPMGDTSVLYGRHENGTFFHGAADAPVTLIDYSDFL